MEEVRIVPQNTVEMVSGEARELAPSLFLPIFENGQLVAGNFSPLLMGSAPEGIVVLGTGIETWTQLPRDESIITLKDGREVRAGFLESMYVQYFEGVPGAVIDPINEKIYIDTEVITDEQKMQVYTDWMIVFENFDSETRKEPTEEKVMEALERYEISERYALSLHRLALFERAYAVKGQQTGLYSWGLTVKDQNGRSIITNEDLFWDGEQLGPIAMALLLKAQWQRRFLQGYAERVIFHMDEPYLTQVGSAHVPTVQNVDLLLNVEFSFENCGAHCCGSTNYNLLFNSPNLKIAALDLTGKDWDGSWENAGYANAFVTSPAGGADIEGFLARGGQIALGVVPFDEEIDARTIVNHVLRIFNELRERDVDVDKYIKQFLVTPVCGAGSRTVSESQHAFTTTILVSKILQEEFIQ